MFKHFKDPIDSELCYDCNTKGNIKISKIITQFRIIFFCHISHIYILGDMIRTG
jgi:hypothetical protein